jgi:thiamine pyrophosphokinase
MPIFNISKTIKIEITGGLKYNLHARKLKPKTAFSVSNCFVIRNN